MNNLSRGRRVGSRLHSEKSGLPAPRTGLPVAEPSVAPPVFVQEMAGGWPGSLTGAACLKGKVLSPDANATAQAWGLQRSGRHPMTDEAQEKPAGHDDTEKGQAAEKGLTPHGKDAPPAPSAGGEEAGSRKGIRAFLHRHPWGVLIGVLVLLALVIGGLLWWLHARHYESTDDAFIDARTARIDSEVAGAITEVSVTDNEPVEAGDILVRIDPRDYQAQLAKAEAQMDEARAQIANAGARIASQQARIDEAQKQVTQADAALTFAKSEARRAHELVERGAGTRQAADRATSNLKQAQAGLDSAEASVTAAQKQIDVLTASRDTARAQLAEAIAARDHARTQLDRTTIRAPVAGRIAQLSAAKGNFASVGQTLMMIVPRTIWVTANFKETQLTDMRPGQSVSISIDAYPDRTFAGHVDSIQSGSGTAFALLPPENATGNFVKVVQRVPVKIVFDDPPGVLLGPGMSVVPRVKVR